MKPKKPNLRAPRPNSAGADAAFDFEANILQLVRGASESRAIEAGEVDAVIDPTSGRAILLPDAQAAVLERKARFRSLVELSTDGHWEQDEDFRFVAHVGAAIGSVTTGDASILGKALWELPFDNDSEIDWKTYRTQLEWRAVFRDLELRCVDGAGTLRIISISGEPIFDLNGRFKGYRGITRDITERKRTDTAAPGSDRFARATLEALSAQVCVLDLAGTIITANAAWRGFAATHGGIGAGVAEGRNYLEACAEIAGNERVDAVAIAAGVRQVIAGERERFRYEYSCDTPTGPCWLIATVTRLTGDDAARAIVAQEDVSELKYAERLVRLEYSVARCLADARETSPALRTVIRAVCEAQNWDCGRYYRLDTAANVLWLDESWAIREAAVEQFMEKSRGAQIRPGAGLAGRVCQSGEPLWMLNGSKKAPTSLTVLAHEIGMDSFVFPVLVEGETIGVLAFASRTVREPDDRLLHAARDIGSQLGQFLRRQQTEDTLRRSESRFRRLTELSADWYWEQDSQFRFTKTVGAGMAGIGDVLGVTLWELPTVVVSDEDWVKHRSQLSAQWSFCDFECATVLPDGQFRHYLISGEPLYDEAGAFTGFHGTGVDITQRRRAEIVARKAAPSVVA